MFKKSLLPQLFFGASFLGVLVLALVLRWLHYTDKPMWYDEVLVVLYSRHGFWDLLQSLNSDQHQPLYYWLVKGMELFSWDDSARKFPSLVFGVLGVAAFQWVAYRLTNFRVALVGSLLLAVNSQHIAYSQMLRMYTMSACLTFVATYGLYRMLEKQGEAKGKWIFVLASVLAFHTHVTSFILFLFQILFVVFCWIDWMNFRFFREVKEFWGKENRREFLWQVQILGSLLCVLLGWTLANRFVGWGLMLFGAAFLFSLLSLYFLVDRSLKPLVNPQMIKVGLNAGMWMLLLSPVFIYCFVGSMLVFYPRFGTVESWTQAQAGLPLLVNNFSYNLVDQAGGRLLGLDRPVFYVYLLFPLGVAIAVLKGQRWAPLLLIHSLFFFFYIYVVGYSDAAVALSSRHFLISLMPHLLFVAYGLVASVEFCAHLGVTLLARGAASVRCFWTATFLALNRKRLAILVSFLGATWVLWLDAGPMKTNVQNWYDQQWEDWRTYGEYYNEHLTPGTLAFFGDQAYQYQVAVYANPATFDLLFHPKTLPGATQRLVWQGASSYEPQRAIRLKEQGFEKILTVYPGGSHIFAKSFPVHSDLQVRPDKNNSWSYETSDFSDYDFVQKADRIENLMLRVKELAPSVSDEWALLQYRFSFPAGRPKSFVTKLSLHTRPFNEAKLLVSTDGLQFEEVTQFEQSINYQGELAEKIGAGQTLYVRLAIKANRLPTDFTDALSSSVLSGLSFYAQY